MTRYEIYVLIVCIVVFTLLTALLTALIWSIVKLIVRTIKGGLEDEKIKIEYFNAMKKRQSKALSFIDKVFSAIIFLCLLAVFAASLCVNVTQKTAVGAIPRLQVVASDSMSQRNPNNKYLFTNGLTDQFDMFDVVVTYQLPEEAELKQYDIVVYEIDGKLVIHRIINIEEPNDRHPNERHFLLQGDYVDSPDKFPVLYSQMRAIYRGDRIPYVGSIVMFLQSPAGYLCLLLVVFAMIVSPIVEKIIERAKRQRLEELLALLGQTRPEIAEAEGFEPKMAILYLDYLAQQNPPKPDPEPVQQAEPEPIKQTAKPCAAPPAPVKKYDWELIFDEFLATLTSDQRREFIPLFALIPMERLPKYQIGGNNRLFFLMFFIYLGHERTKVSDGLMHKIYKYTASLYK